MGGMRSVSSPANISVTSRGLDGVVITITSASPDRWASLLSTLHTVTLSAFHVGAGVTGTVMLLYGWVNLSFIDGVGLALEWGMAAGMAAWLLCGLVYGLLELSLRDRLTQASTWSMQLDNTSVRIPHLHLSLRYSDIFRVSDRAEVRCADGRIVSLAEGEPAETQRWLAERIRQTAAARVPGSPKDVPEALRAARRMGSA